MLRKGSLTGLLLFGIFFGAGNLIFPPALGAQSGSHFWPAIAGFVAKFQVQVSHQEEILWGTCSSNIF